MSNSAALAASSVRLPASSLGTAAAAWVRTSAIILVVALPLVANPFGPDAYSGAKVQALIGLAAVMLVGWACAVAGRGTPPWQATLPEIAVWIFWLAVLVSSVVSVNLRLTLLGAPGRHEGILAVTAYVALFFVGAQFFGSAHGARSLAVAAAAGAVAVIAYGFIQILTPPLFAGEATIRSWYGSMGLLRIFSTLGSPIVFGGYLVLIVPLLLVLGATASRAGGLWLSAAMAGSVATLVTYTRAAWLALAVAIIIMLVLAGRTIWRRHRRVLLAAAAITLAAGIFLATLAGSAPVAQRAASALTLEAGSGGQRVYIWGRTLELIRRRPLLGWGLETLRDVFPYDRPSLERYFGLRPVIIDKAHNDVLQVAVSIGVPGAAAYVGIWILVMAGASRLYRDGRGPSRVLAAGYIAAFAGYLVQAQFSFSTVALAPLVWLMAGAVAGWDAAEQQAGERASDHAEARHGE